jgi:hypothetical protein
MVQIVMKYLPFHHENEPTREEIHTFFMKNRKISKGGALLL